MSWDTATNTAATDSVATPFFAVQIALPSNGAVAAKTLQLLDGAGTVSFSGLTFVGTDPDFGTITAVDSFEDGVAVQSSRCQVSLGVLTSNALALIGQPGAQGAPFTVYLGWLNRATGQPVSTPVVIRTGFLDTTKISLALNSQAVDCDFVGAFEYLTFANDGQSLCSSYHNLFYPTETGFDFVDNVTHQLPWGQNGPRPDQVTLVRNYDTGVGSGTSSLSFGGYGMNFSGLRLG